VNVDLKCAYLTTAITAISRHSPRWLFCTLY